MENSKIEKIWAIWQFIKTIAITTISSVAIIYFATNSDIPVFVKYFTDIIGCLIFISGILLAVLKDIKSKKYLCKKCGNEFIPSIKSYIKGNKCPKCGSNADFLKRDIPL